MTNSFGKAAKGYRASDTRKERYKVSVAWDLEQLEAINRRVVRNNSTFGREARRLMDVGLRNDHLPNQDDSAWRRRMRELGHHGY